jgi:hypothetical protein
VIAAPGSELPGYNLRADLDGPRCGAAAAHGIRSCLISVREAHTDLNEALGAPRGKAADLELDESTVINGEWIGAESAIRVDGYLWVAFPDFNRLCSHLHLLSYVILKLAEELGRQATIRDLGKAEDQRVDIPW